MYDDNLPKTRKRSPLIYLGGPAIALLLWYFNPVEYFDNACTSPFAKPLDHAEALDLYGDKAGAVAAYSTYLRDHPDDTEALEKRGNAYLKLGEADLAIADLTAVLQRRPDDFPAYISRGDAYLLKRDYNDAIADYNRFMDRPGVDLTMSKLFYPRGLAYLGAGRYELAQADFKKDVAQAPNDTFAAKGRDCAAQHSNVGECGSLPIDPNPMLTRIMDNAEQTLSDCYTGPNKL
jgi:tetratricopeptide (TPR) repeat protein